jgi:cytochrome b561
MRATNTETQWGWVARLLHWVTAALIVLQFGLALYIAGIDDLVRRFEATQLHKSWGTVIFCVAVFRLTWRLANRRAPRLPGNLPGWQRRLAGVSQVMLYFLTLALPLSGWVYASASPLQTLMEVENLVFGVVPLPDPWPAGSERIADAAYSIHSAAAFLLAALIALHVCAALKHHFFDSDDVLARMTWSR